jgi:CheY-like chemotaxis protein
MKNANTSARILIVDDDPLSRDVLALLLEHAGFAVNTADSGDAAMQSLRAASTPVPAVVLADMQMPGTTGSALAHALRDHCGAETLLLAMSGSLPADEATRHFDGVLLKPFAIEDLTAAIAARGTPASGPASAPARAVPQNPTLLNEAVYKKLAASMQRGRLQQLYALCLGDIEERIARMRETASNNGGASFRREAHAIKGGAGMVGAVELQRLAGAMEEEGMAANHLASLDELMLACERLRLILLARKIV